MEVLCPTDTLDDWDSFVDESPQGCVFCRSWWLEAICPDGFKILTLQRGSKIVAGIPLVTRKQWGSVCVVMPQLTQTLGVLLAQSNRKTYERRLSYEMRLLESLVTEIPSFDLFSVNLHSSLTNWLPFYWAGYNQTTRYSYVLPDLTDLEKVFLGFAHMKQKNINKAEGLVRVHQNLSADDFFAHHSITLSKQGASVSYSYELFRRLHCATRRHRSGKTWYAIDEQQNIHAAIFVVYDFKSAYFLISSIDPDFANSGAATLLVRDAIAHVAQYTNRFDFEGSMIRGVERSFRKFGAIQTPYFNIRKDNRRLHTKTASRLRRGASKAMRTLGIRKRREQAL